ncbi:MAG: peptide ABC transporter substrate-binding protein [Dehalococcoidia bacterium]
MKITKRRFLVSSLTLGAATAVAAACGSDESDEPSGSQGAGTSAERTQAPSGSYTAAPKDQQVFIAAHPGQPDFLDPHKSQFAVDISVERMLFRPLFWIDEGGLPVAAVAKEIPTQQNGGISDDGKTLKITLKDGQKWSDGSALTAKDFEYSLKRAMNPKLAGPYFDELSNIVGAKGYYESFGTAASPKTPSDADLQQLRDAIGVKALDDKTLEVKLINPQPTITTKLGLWVSYPVKQTVVEQGGDAIENTAWATQPDRAIGNGPFVLKEYREKDRIVLEANPNYTLEPKPKLSRIEMRIIDDDETRFAAFQTGEVNVSAIPTSKIPLVDSDPELKKQNIRGPEPTVFWLQFMHEDPAFKDQRVRQAMAKAIDRDALVKVVLGGVSNPTTLFMHNSTPGQNKTDGDSLKYDPAAAKKLMSDAGFANGQGYPTLSLITTDATVSRNMAEFVQKQLKDNVGINVNLEVLDSKTRSSRYSNSQFQLAIGGWHEDYHDPENWLPTLMMTGASNNQLKYSNPRFDELVKQAMFELDTEKRFQTYAQANKVMLEDAAVGPIYERVRNQVVAPKVKNLTPHPQDSAWAGDLRAELIEIAAS